MTITEMCEKAHKTAKEHGFWDGMTLVSGKMVIPTNTMLVKLALIHSEVSEAVEEVRAGNTQDTFRAANTYSEPSSAVPGSFIKTTGSDPVITKITFEKVSGELADILIRTADFASALGLDLEKAVQDKMIKNLDRPRLHGRLT